jgi:hypothetical protein
MRRPLATVTLYVRYESVTPAFFKAAHSLSTGVKKAIGQLDVVDWEVDQEAALDECMECGAILQTKVPTGDQHLPECEHFGKEDDA